MTVAHTPLGSLMLCCPIIHARSLWSFKPRRVGLNSEHEAARLRAPAVSTGCPSKSLLPQLRCAAPGHVRQSAAWTPAAILEQPCEPQGRWPIDPCLGYLCVLGGWVASGAWPGWPGGLLGLLGMSANQLRGPLPPFWSGFSNLKAGDLGLPPVDRMILLPSLPPSFPPSSVLTLHLPPDIFPALQCHACCTQYGGWCLGPISGLSSHLYRVPAFSIPGSHALCLL